MTNSAKKILITNAVLDQLPNLSKYNVENASSEWWVRPSGKGLRLTVLGDQCFRLADIEFFEFPLEKTLRVVNLTQFLLDLTYKITCPYFIDHTKIKSPVIRLYDSQVAMMINLYGDLNDYINQTTPKRK